MKFSIFMDSMFPKNKINHDKKNDNIYLWYENGNKKMTNNMIF